MSMNIILATPEYIKAEIEARYAEPGRRHRHTHSSLEVEQHAHRLRTSEGARRRRFTRAALAR